MARYLRNSRIGILVSLTLWSGHLALAGQDLPSVAPEEAGWSSERLAEAAAYAKEIGYDALILAHDGRVFFSWGQVRKNYKLHSIRKPLLGALYGLYVENGTLDLSRTVQELGIDDRPPHLTAREKQATVRHLLQARSGIYHEAAGETEDMEESRPRRGQYGPGEHFYYNNWDFNALGTIFRQRTGKDIFREFQARIAEPIGMQDFDPDDCGYVYSSVSEHPTYSFRMSARDLLRFGILYQKGGHWDGVEVVPENWIRESTSSEFGAADPVSGSGFGYLWGLMEQGSPLADLAGGAGYFFTGYGGHALVVIPELELVYVLRVDTDGSFETPRGTGRLMEMIRDARMGDTQPPRVRG